MQTSSAVVRAAGVASLIFVSAGCKPRDAFDPPRRFQLVCKAEKAESSFIFVLDTARGSARWVNGSEPAPGKFKATPETYVLTVPASVTTQALSGTINRYDGHLAALWGAPPSRAKGAVQIPGRDGRDWRCTKDKAGPKL